MNCEIQVTTGTTGSGKSYTRTKYVVDELLPNSDLSYLTNLPLKVNEIAKWFKGKEKSNPLLKDVSKRIQFIDRDMLKAWAAGKGGIWDLITPEMSNVHIAIDEAQHIWGPEKKDLYVEDPNNPGKKIDYITRTKRFLSELRHEGLRIEFITQFHDGLHEDIVKAAGRIEALQDGRSARDPWWGIEFNDWYQLAKKWLEIDILPFRIDVFLKRAGKHVLDPLSTRRVPRIGSYFKLYDSYAPPLFADPSGPPKRIKEIWEIKSMLGVLVWFVAKNWAYFLFSKMTWSIVLVLSFLMFFRPAIASVVGYFTGMGSRMSQAAAAENRKNEGVKEPQKLLAPDPLPVQQAVRVKDEEIEEQAKPDDRYTLKMITPTHCVFGGCVKVAVNERIPHGEHEGKKILKIDYPARRVELSDGTILSLFGLPSVPAVARNPPARRADRKRDETVPTPAGYGVGRPFASPLSRPARSSSTAHVQRPSDVGP